MIYLVPSAGLRRVHDPLVLLTRSPLPSLPEFPVFLDGNIETKVVFVPQRSPYAIEQTMLLSLKGFTLQVFQDLFNKDYEAEDAQMPYWLAPTRWCPGDAAPQYLTEMVDLNAVINPKPIQWSPNSDPGSWCEQFLIDKWSGKYRYWSKAVLQNLDINSPIPVNVPERRFKGAKADKVLDYTLSLYGKAKLRFLENCDRSQPVLEAELVQIRRNFLDRAEAKEFEDYVHSYHVCPEPLAMSMVSTTS